MTTISIIFNFKCDMGRDKGKGKRGGAGGRGGKMYIANGRKYGH